MLSHLTEEVINHMLTSQWFGRLGCASGTEVLVVPVTYLYDGHCLYGHTREGTKTRLMRENPNVCLEVNEVVSPTYWRSVVVHGVYEELTGDDRVYALQRLGNRMAPLFAHEITSLENYQGETFLGSGAPNTVVYRIRITKKSGRAEQR
ncbi:pyridoxamine 5'-phosphate oxidase family protein [Rudanella lutea]|uniref:pyridoxamine 5'-phosphate oxidase family protein n=1 Tax=Rudanella lutea TaxID=451374 RepID=UPI00036C6967|nr:pyridoxamine 5'-phosphate oxidase family protein [Rudanella lutea]